MFTGIVEELGEVVALEPQAEAARLSVRGKIVTADAGHGESIAVNGVCLTVVDASNGALSFDLLDETTARAKPFGSEVNLEPALRAGEPLGGHYVQGHVDGVGTVRSTGDPVWIDTPPELLRYVVEKGSIAVDGVSLTVAALDDGGFAVALVPHTLEVTTLGRLQPGDRVNLEVDILAKYVERLLRSEP